MPSYPFDESLYNEELQCVVYNILYDYKSKEGTLIMDDDSCCDMSGCVDLFIRIDPSCRKIKTFAGTLQDTCYKKNSRNEWIVYYHR